MNIQSYDAHELVISIDLKGPQHQRSLLHVLELVGSLELYDYAHVYIFIIYAPLRCSYQININRIQYAMPCMVMLAYAAHDEREEKSRP